MTFRERQKFVDISASEKERYLREKKELESKGLEVVKRKYIYK